VLIQLRQSAIDLFVRSRVAIIAATEYFPELSHSELLSLFIPAIFLRGVERSIPGLSTILRSLGEEKEKVPKESNVHEASERPPSENLPLQTPVAQNFIGPSEDYFQLQKSPIQKRDAAVQRPKSAFFAPKKTPR
jgi:hypothetical protein